MSAWIAFNCRFVFSHNLYSIWFMSSALPIVFPMSCDCFGKNQGICRMPCGHLLHKSCITAYLNHQTTQTAAPRLGLGLCWIWDHGREKLLVVVVGGGGGCCCCCCCCWKSSVQMGLLQFLKGFEFQSRLHIWYMFLSLLSCVLGDSDKGVVST